LVLGALSGLLLAGSGLKMGDSERGVGAGVAVRVNGEAIVRSEVERVAEAIRVDLKTPQPEEEVMSRALERLIDEELLVQHGLALGLPAKDRTLRNALAAAVLSGLVAGAEAGAEELDEASMARLYQEEGYRFRRLDRLRLRVFYFEGERALIRANQAVKALGQDHKRQDINDDVPVLEVPEGWLTVSKLRDYFRSEVVVEVKKMRAGDVGEPFKEGRGWWVPLLLERREGELPPLTTVREALVVEHRRQLGERAVREFLEQGRQDAKIERQGAHP